MLYCIKQTIGLLSSDQLSQVQFLQNVMKEGRSVLFNDALNTFYFLFTVIWRRTYGKGPLR